MMSNGLVLNINLREKLGKKYSTEWVWVGCVFDYKWEKPLSVKHVAGHLTSLEHSRVDCQMLLNFYHLLFIIFYLTRSYAALRAADLDWIVGPGYSLGRVHSGEKP